MPGRRAQFETLSHRLSSAATHQISPISNRKRKLLEFDLTHTKQSTSFFLIDNFGASFSRRPPQQSTAQAGELLTISNRPCPRLESLVTHTKQRTGPLSNRPYSAICNLLSFSPGHSQQELMPNSGHKFLRRALSVQGFRRCFRSPLATCYSLAPSEVEGPLSSRPPILAVDPAALNSRDYALAISLQPHHRGIQI